jgi:tetratricopeptide (TPR) repeat protein
MNIANAVGAEFSLEEQASIEKVPTNSPEAYALYLRALASSRTNTGIWQDLMDQAIELDPDFALAHAMKAYRIAAGLNSVVRQQVAIRESAERALAIDPELGLAHSALALLHQANASWADAKEASESALQFNPNDADAHGTYSRLSRYLGDYARGVELGQRAVELDPNNQLVRYQLGINFRYARDCEAASATFRDASNLDPSRYWPHLQLAFSEICLGNDQAAADELELAEQLMPEGAWRIGYRLAQLSLAYSQLDRPEDVDRMVNLLVDLDQETPVGEGVWAMTYGALGNYDEALSWLEEAVNDQALNVPSLGELKANAVQDPVLDQPRFQALLNRIGVIE